MKCLHPMEWHKIQAVRIENCEPKIKAINAHFRRYPRSCKLR